MEGCLKSALLPPSRLRSHSRRRFPAGAHRSGPKSISRCFMRAAFYPSASGGPSIGGNLASSAMSQCGRNGMLHGHKREPWVGRSCVEVVKRQ